MGSRRRTTVKVCRSEPLSLAQRAAYRVASLFLCNQLILVGLIKSIINKINDKFSNFQHAYMLHASGRGRKWGLKWGLKIP
jgi:hypothetical protein